MSITTEQLGAVRDLYDRGRMLDAHELARSYAPLTQWRGGAARVLAGRLGANLGSPRMAAVLHRIAYKESPEHPEAIYFHARNLHERRGPLAAWEFLRGFGASTTQADADRPLAGADDELAADWLAFHASILGAFRDFEPAERYIARAIERAPEKPWVWIERSSLYEAQDRYPEALQAARRALEIRPWHRPGVQQLAHMLQLLDRDEEALSLLIEAERNVQSGPMVMQLAALQTELAMYDAARESWIRSIALMPLLDRNFRRYLSARQSDAAYYCGDVAEAVRLGRLAKIPFHDKVIERIEKQGQEGKRASLKVPFVRQHHMTCAPATLSALSRFWKLPAEHLNVAEEICYDGTPAHSERAWAATNGYVAREFRVTFESAAALIDRGLPFTLTTVEPTNAHLQACIGYDMVRGTLMIRDPFSRVFGEFNAEPFFERYKASGPRGMVMVPQAQAALLEGLNLPDAELYDDLYAFMTALVGHRRTQAQQASDQLNQRAPGHRLSLTARRALANYDGDHAAALAVTDELLALYPDDGGLILQRIGYLRGLGRREERLAVLRKMAHGEKPDPIFWSFLAQELKDDARDHAEALRIARKAVRIVRGDARGYFTLAGLLWDKHRRTQAVELYRFAAAMEDKSDMFAGAYFSASRYLKQTRVVIRLLVDRFNRDAKKSAQPALALFRAYEEIDRPTEAFKVLDKALARRPDEGELLLTAANARARYAQFDQAEALLARAKDKTRKAGWLRGSAEVASYRGDADRARELWKQVLAIEPLAVDAHRELAELLARAGGSSAAIAHLRSACDRFPYFLPLRHALLGWIYEEGLAAAEPEIRRHLALHPTDTLSRRQLVLALAGLGKGSDAVKEANELLKIDPSDPATFHARGLALAAVNRFDEARESYRRAIRISVDADYAIADLIKSCDTPLQRRKELGFVQAELVRQTILGDGLLAFRTAAADVTDPQELLTALKQALAARPDLWHAHAAVMQQLQLMNRLDDAAAAGRAAVARFPLLPRLWLELADVQRLQNDADGEAASLRQAIALAPGWGEAVRRLAETHERRHELDQAAALLEGAAARNPLDVVTMGMLANVYWESGRKEQAIERASQAVKLEPGYRWAWEVLRRWSSEIGAPDRAVEMARSLTRTRGGEARSWVVLARTLEEAAPTSDGGGRLAERLAALDRALVLNPRLTEAHDLKVRLLHESGRVDEARAACRPKAFGGRPPVELLVREAVITYEQGEVEQAVDRLKAILAEDPTFYTGWLRLIDWHRSAGDKDAFIGATARMIKQWPHDAIALCAFGDGRLAAEDRPGAKAAYHRATQVAPDDADAALALFDLQIEDNEVADAADTLSAIQKHHQTPAVMSRAVVLDVKHEDRPTAARRLAELAVAESNDPGPLRHAVAAMHEADWKVELRQSMSEAVANPACNEWAGDCLVLLDAEAGAIHQLGPWADFFLSLQKPDGALTPAAVSGVCRILNIYKDMAGGGDPGEPNGGDEKAGRQALRQFIASRREALRANTRLWGTVGYVLQSIRDYPHAADWLADWQHRPDAEGWMLVNLAEALRAMNRDAEAEAVTARGFEISRNEPRAIHGLWRAADALRAGDPAGSAAAIMAMDADMKYAPEPYQFLRGMLEAVLFVFDAADRRAQFEQSKKMIGEAIAIYPTFNKDRELWRLYQKLLALLGRSGIGFGGWLWCLSKRF